MEVRGKRERRGDKQNKDNSSVEGVGMLGRTREE